MTRLVCVLHWFVSTNKRLCLVVSSQTRKAISSTLVVFFFFFFLPVTSFSAGIAASGSGTSAVAFGLAWVFSRQASHVLVRVGSPHSADREAGKHTTRDTVEQRDARKWGRRSQLNNNAMCVIHRPSKLRRTMCKMCVSAASPTAWLFHWWQWKGSISSLLASGPCHLIQPVGEKSIQSLKPWSPSGGPVLFAGWRAEQSRKQWGRVTVVCCPPRNRGNWATGHQGAALSVCQGLTWLRPARGLD